MNTRTISLIGMVVMAAVLRLLPHPWNFTPVTAMALFAGAHFATRRAALLVPFGALFLSDLVLGFYPSMAVTYVSFGLIVLLGATLGARASAPKILATSAASSCLFFVLSNFGVWLLEGMYPRTGTGLLACYTAALPFFQGTFLGDLTYTAALFGALRVAEQKLPSLQQASTL